MNYTSFPLTLLACIILGYLVKDSSCFWVGPVWGYDGEERGDDYFLEERKRVSPDMIAPPFTGYMGSRMQKREQDSRVQTFYCVPSEAKECKMGGKGPTIYKKLSPDLAICVCFCPTGYEPKKGCLTS